MEVSDVFTHLAAGGGGATTVGGVFLFILKGWQKRQSKFEKKLDAAMELLVRLDERVKTLSDALKTQNDHAVQLGVLEERTNKHAYDLNGLGGKIREITSQ